MSNKNSHTTTDHKVIQEWIEKRNGRPACVKGTGDDKDPGLLRIDFNEKEDRLEEISWDEFFDKFEENKLALLYQVETAGGQESRFFKFVKRD